LLEVRKDGAAGALEQYVPMGLRAVPMGFRAIWSLRYIDSPVLRDRDADGNAATGDLGAAASGMEQRVYYLTDGNFNPNGAPSGVTTLAGTDGAILERYAYDAYGQPRVYDPNWASREYGSSYANAILFCGYFRDAETGMYHVRHRYYHPQLGRWMSRDPLGYVDGMNSYEYVSGCPTVWSDYLGLLKVFIWNTHPEIVNGWQIGLAWGHASLQLDDGTYISFWPSNTDRQGKGSLYSSSSMEPNDLAQDEDWNGHKPDSTTKVCGLDEDAIRDWWDKMKKDKPRWDSTSNNCCNAADAALRAGGAAPYIRAPNIMNS